MEEEARAIAHTSEEEAPADFSLSVLFPGSFHMRVVVKQLLIA